MFKIVKVKGDSMQPCYHHNDFVLLKHVAEKALQKGDDIVCRHHQFGLILKRIKNITLNKLELTGLNTSSTSSSMLGTINTIDVVGRVIWHIKKPNI